MPVATGVVGDAQLAARVAALDLAAEAGRAAALYRRHHLQRDQAQMPGLIDAIDRTGGAQDVGQLNGGGRRGGHTIPDLWAAICQAFRRFTAQDCCNYIAAVGYENDLAVAT